MKERLLLQSHLPIIFEEIVARTAKVGPQSIEQYIGIEPRIFSRHIGSLDDFVYLIKLAPSASSVILDFRL